MNCLKRLRNQPADIFNLYIRRWQKWNFQILNINNVGGKHQCLQLKKTLVLKQLKKKSISIKQHLSTMQFPEESWWQLAFCFVLTLRYVSLSLPESYHKTLWIFPQCLSVETNWQPWEGGDNLPLHTSISHGWAEANCCWSIVLGLIQYPPDRNIPRNL